MKTREWYPAVPPPELAIDECSLIVAGSFNPAVFSPSWLLALGIIGAGEFADAELEVITRDIAVFRVGWLRCQVTPEALQCSTADVDEFERTRDAVGSILRALPHTPITAIGITRAVHFVVEDSEQWHAIGDVLVPKQPWEGLLLSPGMRNLTVWGARPDRYAGRIQAQVEPSFRVPQAVFVAVNDHFQLRIDESEPDSRTRESAWAEPTAQELSSPEDRLKLALEILQSEWLAAYRRASDLIRRVAKQAALRHE